MQIKLLIGIDASVENFGIACLQTSDTDLALFSGNMVQMLEKVKQICEQYPGAALVVLEDSNMESTTFGVHGSIMGALGGVAAGKMLQKQAKSKIDIAMKVAQKAGKVMAAAQIVKQFCNVHGIPCLCVSPSERQRAYRMEGNAKIPLNPTLLKMPTKTTAAQFEILTGYEGKSNEHNRDAATLIWGRSAAWVRIMEKKFNFNPKSTMMQKVSDKFQPIILVSFFYKDGVLVQVSDWTGIMWEELGEKYVAAAQADGILVFTIPTEKLTFAIDNNVIPF